MTAYKRRATSSVICSRRRTGTLLTLSYSLGAALTALYKNLSFVEMGKLLGLSVEDAQSLVAKMIGEKRVMGKIDEVEGIVYFKKEPKQGEGRVAAVCQLFNECVAEIEKE